MQYIIPAFVALAISANAAPHQWHFPSGFPAPPAPAPGASGLVPTGTGVALPTGTGFPAQPGYNKTVVRAAADDDEEEEEEEEEEESSSSDEEEEEEEEESSSSSDEEEEEESDSSSSTSTSGSSNSTASSSGSTVTSAASVSDASSASSGGSLPASSGSSALDAVQTIAAGESFDGGMVMYDRGVECSGQSEGGDSDAVFYLEAGASISNVIIGPNQAEGIHCFGECTLTNVWWSAVCEDAFTIKEQDAGATTTITGGGAFGAEDKVLQHNGGGTLSVSGFTVETFGKLYRSCGNCDEMFERHVIFDDITATDGKSLAGINSNYGDTATFTNVVASGVSDICVEYEGNDTGDEPEEISSGPSDYCIYSTSDVTSS